MRRMFCSESGLARFFTGFILGRAGGTANASVLCFPRGRRRQMPGLPFLVVLALRQKGVTRMLGCAHPGDEVNEVRLCHRGAAGTRPRDATTDMEENRAARTGTGRIRVVSNFHQPSIREIGVTH